MKEINDERRTGSMLIPAWIEVSDHDNNEPTHLDPILQLLNPKLLGKRRAIQKKRKAKIVISAMVKAILDGNDNLIFFFTVLLIVIFFFKAVISILIRWMITSFSWHQFSILQVKVLSAYQNMKYEDHISRSNSEYIRNIRELCGECLTNIELTLKIISDLIILFVIMFFLALINYKILLLFFLTIFPIFLIY